MPTGMRQQRKDVTEWMGFNHDNSSETHHSPNHAYMYVRNVWIIVGVCNSSMVETYIYLCVCNSSIHILSIVKYMQVVNRLIKLNIRLTINTLSLSHQTKKELEAGINDIHNCYITIVFPTCLHPARKSTLIMHLIFI